MTDQAFLEGFEAGRLAEFHHRDHIRMAWLYLSRLGPERGAAQIVQGIRRFAELKDARTLYHETLTRFWIRLVAAAMAQAPAAPSFDAFLAAHPELADKERPRVFYRRETLMSDSARACWVEPDLAALP